MARVLVTGAAGGLGRSLVHAFTARGDDVLATDLRGADLALDVTSDTDWAAAREHVERTWGGLDDIARAVVEGIERGDELILPDDAARAAYRLKGTDRPAYDATMRAQACRLEEHARG